MKYIKPILFIFSILLIVIILLYVFQEKTAIAEQNKQSTAYSIRGIDVSHHNGTPKWTKVKAGGVDFVYIKASEGVTHFDQHFYKNSKLAKDAGLKVGAYHFYAFGLSGIQQANNFLHIVKYSNLDLLPAIDVEINTLNPASSDSLFVNKVVVELQALENRLFEFYGVRPIMYTNLECYNLYIKDNFPDNLLWIVDLDNEPSDSLNNWRIWQHSHRGNVSGVEGYVDLNYYRFSMKKFDELLLP